MEEFDLVEEVFEDVWLEFSPTLTRQNTGVECTTCGAITPLKYHSSRSGFSFTCNKCRRVKARRAAQKRYSVRAAAKTAKINRSLKKDALAKLDVLIERASTGVAELELTLMLSELSATSKQMTKLDTLRQNLAIYMVARAEVVRDMKFMKGKPLDEYLTSAREKLEREITHGPDTGRKGKGRHKEAAQELRS